MTPIDEQILAAIRAGRLEPLGGYTSDTAWGVVFRDGKFYSWRYDESYERIYDELSEEGVIAALEGSGLKRRILEKGIPPAGAP